MNQVLKIAAGVALGGIVVLFINRAWEVYEFKLLVKQLEETPIPHLSASKAHTLKTEEIPPRSAKSCLEQSNGTYDEAYLDCRYGLRVTYREDPRTGKATVIKKERINQVPNVL